MAVGNLELDHGLNPIADTLFSLHTNQATFPDVLKHPYHVFSNYLSEQITALNNKTKTHIRQLFT